MDIVKDLITKFWRLGILFLIGFLLIIYIALGAVYLQQGTQQKELEKQIAKLSAVVTRPLPSDEKLREDYDAVNRALAPMADSAAIALLVSIAENSGIDVNPEAGRLRISPVSVSSTMVDGDNYQLMTFKGIYVQGPYENVMAFISDLDSGETLKTMVLTRVAINQIEIGVTGEEIERRAEFREVVSAVQDMMSDNDLLEIPDPMNFAHGVATNLMGDDPDTVAAVEGFPDVTTTAAEKDYTGTGSLRDGYVLYEHDLISTDDTTQFETVSYITKPTTKYYYTCEADGTVRQFDGSDIDTATEYLAGEESAIETVAILDVSIYTKLR